MSAVMQITVTCPDWLAEIIEKKAQETTRSRSAYIVHILKEAHIVRASPKPKPLAPVYTPNGHRIRR